MAMEMVVENNYYRFTFDSLNVIILLNNVTRLKLNLLEGGLSGERSFDIGEGTEVCGTIKVLLVFGGTLLPFIVGRVLIL